MRILLAAIPDPVTITLLAANSSNTRHYLPASASAECCTMGLLKVTGTVVGCNLLVGVQLGQLGRFGRLTYKIRKLMQVMMVD